MNKRNVKNTSATRDYKAAPTNMVEIQVSLLEAHEKLSDLVMSGRHGNSTTLTAAKMEVTRLEGFRAGFLAAKGKTR